MSDTKIEWTQKSWNPITGCTPISEGCQNCYAKKAAWSPRLRGRFGYPEDDPFRVTFHPDRLELPLHWKKPQKIFVNSMGDLFHGDVKNRWISEIISIIRRCPQHVFQVLTKRPDRMKVCMFHAASEEDRLSRLRHLWLGVTVENAKHKDRIDILRKIPAAVRFISFEPLLGDVGELDLTGIHWVIVGGETGPKARRMYITWADRILRQCQKKGIPFFYKGCGTYFCNKKHPTYMNLWGREWHEFPEVEE